MQTRNLTLETVTPLFSYGAYSNVPEFRAASVRGQLRYWFRMLGGSSINEGNLFGSVKEAVASRLVVRTAILTNWEDKKHESLPGKPGGKAGRKQALPPKSRFSVEIINRFRPLDSQEWTFIDRTIEAWLHLGALGTRCNRGGGSLQRADHPMTWDSWRGRTLEIVKNTDAIPVYLSQPSDDQPRSFHSESDARNVICDTLGGPKREGLDDLRNLKEPLGFALGKDRKGSPLKLRVIRDNGGKFYVVGCWDGRTAVTGNRIEHLDGIIKLLKNREKELGNLRRLV